MEKEVEMDVAHVKKEESNVTVRIFNYNEQHNDLNTNCNIRNSPLLYEMPKVESTL